MREGGTAQLNYTSPSLLNLVEHHTTRHVNQSSTHMYDLINCGHLLVFHLVTQGLHILKRKWPVQNMEPPLQDADHPFCNKRHRSSFTIFLLIKCQLFYHCFWFAFVVFYNLWVILTNMNPDVGFHSGLFNISSWELFPATGEGWSEESGSN